LRCRGSAFEVLLLTFVLIQVTDSQCPGSVIADAATYKVDWVPRPSANLSQIEAKYEPYNNSHILPPICEGIEDHVDLDLTGALLIIEWKVELGYLYVINVGRPPFQILYNIAKNSDEGLATRLLDQLTFSSIQPRTRFQLHTSTSGRMYYEVKQVGDAAYPLSMHNTVVIPPAERLLFEQEVVTRPSAQFKTNQRPSYCLYDPFTPRDLASSDGTIILEGSPPFILELSIKDLATSKVIRKAFEVFDKTWKIDLPSYIFRSIGPHLVSIESVEDSSHCQQGALDPLARSIWVDVAEAAAIYPFDRRTDLCVSDVSQFQLEGTPPWTIRSAAFRNFFV
jgi:nucleoporin POM152